MQAIAFEDGAIQIDAEIVAEGLGIEPPLLKERMRDGQITTLSERGIEADNGRYRVSFFSEHRRFRLVVDQTGTIIQRSTLDFGHLPLPGSARRPGG